MSLPAEKPDVPRTGPPAPARRGGSLNLARRPFINTRPVTRVSILLWLLGLLLLFGNVSLFWSYLQGSEDKRAQLENLQQEVQRKQQTVNQLEERLASLDLEEQNREVRFLNRQISERTFSWSLLFDRLAQVLPDDVRLTRLAPERKSRRTVREEENEKEPADNRVQLIIQGESRSDEALYSFVDRLFAHPSFENPNISREAREDKGDVVEFDVQVVYIPGSPASPGVEIQEEGPVVVPGGAPQAPAAPAPAAPAAPATSGPGGRPGAGR
jgi:Tfp pilus assembly protein PilN